MTLQVLAILCVLEVAMISGIVVLDRRAQRRALAVAGPRGRIPTAIVRRAR